MEDRRLKEDYSEIEQKLLKIVQDFVEELGMERAAKGVSRDASLERDLGLASLERIELLLQIEKAFGVRLPDRLMAEARTPGDLARAIVHGLPAEATRPFVQAVPRPADEKEIAPPASAETLTEVLVRHAERDPDRPHVHLQVEGGKELTVTYRNLLDGAFKTAGGLAAKGLKPEEAVGIMLPTGVEFFEAFFGVLLAGGIPVPLYPPYRADQIEEFSRRQAAILKRAEARLLIVAKEIAGLARLLKPFSPSLRGAFTVDDLKTSFEGRPNPMLRGDDTALVQFTSGSTAEPKGVELTHRNLLANIRAIGEAIEIRPTDAGVSWLPLYHDMGLIGSWLFSLYYGIPIAILSPLAFLSRPERWLWTIHYHRATLSAAPNFAYEFCVHKIDDRAIEGLDLSSWRIAFNGSEPVSPDTLTRFIRRFAPFGFRPEAHFPVYGLAESSVALAFPPLGRPPRIDRVARSPFVQRRKAEAASPSESSFLRFVSCGAPLPGHEIRIVDDAGKEVEERIEGSLYFRGPSAMKGYYHDASATRSILHDGWWDSEDLAYRAEGEFFITGRRKDVIIKAGRNLYPQEVEEIAGDIDGIRKGCVAAFGVFDPSAGTEKLIVVAETREEREETRSGLASEVMERVAVATGVRPDEVLIVPARTVPKTSSGKLRRSACRDAYLGDKIIRKKRAPWLQIARLYGTGFWASFRRKLIALQRLIYAGYVGTCLIATLLPAWLAMTVLPRGRAAQTLSRWWARGVLRLAGWPLTVEGGIDRTGKGPQILLPNHSSYLDAVVLMAALPPGFLFTAKKELRERFIVRTFIRKAGHLVLDRLDFSKSVEDTLRIEEALNRNLPVLIFPEGTFSRVRGLRPFRLGAFKIAVERSIPVLPIAIRGTREILWPGSWLPRREKIKVIIGAPIEPQGREWREVIRLRDAAKEEIIRLSGETPIDLVSAVIPEE
jgi:fatty-acyl-CoA synthase